MLDISSDKKEAKIAKVKHLVPKFYDEGSFVSPKKLVSRISRILKPNQWLRLEDAKYGIYNYDKPINYEQRDDAKPKGIWASKGEWQLSGKMLTLLEVDYTKILVLATKADYLEFENKYCYKMPINGDMFGRKRTKKSFRQNSGKSVRNSDDRLICMYFIDWKAVAEKYDGVALIPNPSPYFPRSKYKNGLNEHLWLRTYDVSSLVIWNHDGKKPITKHIVVGNITEMQKQIGYNGNKAKKDIISLDTTSLDIKLENKFYNLLIKNIKKKIVELENI